MIEKMINKIFGSDFNQLVFKTLFLSTIVLFSASCVSVKLPSAKPPTKSKNVNFKRPVSPFSSANPKGADALWVSKNTASTISYFSSCSENEPALEVARANAFISIEGADVKKEQSYSVDDRQGLMSDIEGNLEGVPVKIRFLVFKKGDCSYHLTYVSLKENFDREVEHYTKFVKSFKAP